YGPRPHQLIDRCPSQKQKPGGDRDSNIGDEPNQDRTQRVAHARPPPSQPRRRPPCGKLTTQRIDSNQTAARSYCRKGAAEEPYLNHLLEVATQVVARGQGRGAAHAARKPEPRFRFE